MSKPCAGIALGAIRLADTMKQTDASAAASAPVVQRYMAPSMRAAVAKVATLSSDDISSDVLFPSLAPMKPATAGASWGQLRARLSSRNQFAVLDEDDAPPLPQQPMNFKGVMEERIARDREEQADAERRENITDPVEMSIEQRRANGWSTLFIPRDPIDFVAYNDRIASRLVLDEDDYFNAKTTWTTAGFTEEQMTDPRKFPTHADCVHLGGAPIERSNKPEPDFFAKQGSDARFPTSSDSSEKRAKKALFSFVGK